MRCAASVGIFVHEAFHNRKGNNGMLVCLVVDMLFG